MGHSIEEGHPHRPMAGPYENDEPIRLRHPEPEYGEYATPDFDPSRKGVEENFAIAENLLRELGEEIAATYDRLQPVISPYRRSGFAEPTQALQQDSAHKSRDRVPDSELAERLRALGQHVKTLRDQVREMRMAVDV